MAENQSILAIAGAAGTTAFTFVATGAAGVADVSSSVAPTLVGCMGVAYTTSAAGKEVNVVVSGFCDVECAAVLPPGASVTNDATGKAVAAVGGATNDIIYGEYAPLPVSGVRPSSVSGERIRILLYQNKLTAAV